MRIKCDLETFTPFDFKFFWESFGQEYATINGQSVKVVVAGGSKRGDSDPREIRTNTPLACGDLVDYKGSNWLAISEVAVERLGIYKAQVRLCPFNVNVKTGEEQVLIGYDAVGRPVYETRISYAALPAIIDSKTFGIDEGMINIATGQLLITLQENETSLLIGLNDRLTKFNSAWLVTGIDRTRKGLICLTVDKTQTGADDPPDPDAVESEPSDPPLADEVIVVGANDLLYGNTATYTATVSINGATDSTAPVVWSLFADDQTGTATAAEFSPAPTTAQSCTLKGKTNTVTYIQLKCTLQSDPTTVAWKRIRCKSLM